MNEKDIRVEVPLKDQISIEYAEGLVDECRAMVGFALDKLDARLNTETLDRFAGVTVQIGPGLTDGGGETKADERLILLNSDKVSMSLQESENFLVQQGYFELGERTRTLPDIKDQPWSTLVYELIHEFGHILEEEIPIEFSPTKYGKRAEHEAFCEAWTYWILGQEVDPKAKQAVLECIK